MRSPKKGQQPMRLQDLANTIDCIQCGKEKPASGSRLFHACHVCADCSQKLALLSAAAPSMSKSAQ
jgi:hypothetical protein